jgi:hypothetical protein
MTGISERLAAASGAAGVVVLIVGGEIFNGDGPLARAGYALVVLSFVAFIVFLAFLHRILREAEGPGGWVATLALGAGLVYAAVRFAAQPPRMVAFYRDDLTPESARTLVDLNDTAFVSSGLLLGLFVAAAAWVFLVHRVLTRWIGWVGLVSGVLAVAAGVVGMAYPAGYFPVPFLAGLLWILVVSVLLTVRPRRAVGEPGERLRTGSLTVRAGRH